MECRINKHGQECRVRRTKSGAQGGGEAGKRHGRPFKKKTRNYSFRASAICYCMNILILIDYHSVFVLLMCNFRTIKLIRIKKLHFSKSWEIISLLVLQG